MANLAVVWKLSITENEYKCTKCGRKLLDVTYSHYLSGGLLGSTIVALKKVLLNLPKRIGSG